MTLSSFPTFVDAITSRSHILKIHTLSLTFSVTSPSKDPFSSNCRLRNIFIVFDQLSPITIVVTPLLFEFQLPFWSDPLLTNDLRNSGRISFSAVVCHEYSFFLSFSLRHLPYSSDYFLHMSSSCFLLCILIALIICTASVTMQTSLLFSICSSLYSRSLSYYCFGPRYPHGEARRPSTQGQDVRIRAARHTLRRNSRGPTCTIVLAVLRTLSCRHLARQVGD